MSRGVFLPSVLLRVLLTLFPCCLSIRLFCYAPFVPIFCSKIVLFPYNPVVGRCLCFHPLFSDRIHHCYYYSLWIFHTSVSWGSFIGIWVTVSFLRFPELFSSMMADLNNAVVWMVWAAIFNPSSPPYQAFEDFPSTPTIIGITVTFMFHNYFSFLVVFNYLFLFSFSFIFSLCSSGTAKSTIWQILFLFIFLLTITRSGLLTGIRWSVCISKSQRILRISFSRMDSWFVHISFGSMVIFIFLA